MADRQRRQIPSGIYCRGQLRWPSGRCLGSEFVTDGCTAAQVRSCGVPHLSGCGSLRETVTSFGEGLEADHGTKQGSLGSFGRRCGLCLTGLGSLRVNRHCNQRRYATDSCTRRYASPTGFWGSSESRGTASGVEIARSVRICHGRATDHGVFFAPRQSPTLEGLPPLLLRSPKSGRVRLNLCKGACPFALGMLGPYGTVDGSWFRPVRDMGQGNYRSTSIVE